MAERTIYFNERKIGDKHLFTLASISEDGVITIERDSATGSRNHVILNLKALEEIVANAKSGVEVEIPKDEF